MPKKLLLNRARIGFWLGKLLCCCYESELTLCICDVDNTEFLESEPRFVKEVVNPDIGTGLSPTSAVVGFFGGWPLRFMQAKYPYRSPCSQLKMVLSKSVDRKGTFTEPPPAAELVMESFPGSSLKVVYLVSSL